MQPVHKPEWELTRINQKPLAKVELLRSCLYKVLWLLVRCKGAFLCFWRLGRESREGLSLLLAVLALAGHLWPPRNPQNKGIVVRAEHSIWQFCWADFCIAFFWTMTIFQVFGLWTALGNRDLNVSWES